jgi:hypothetical protein
MPDQPYILMVNKFRTWENLPKRTLDDLQYDLSTGKRFYISCTHRLQRADEVSRSAFSSGYAPISSSQDRGPCACSEPEGQLAVES